MGPRGRAGGDEDLHIGVGTDDRADVASVENRAARTRGEGALRLDQRRADARHRGDHGRRLAHLASAQGRVVEIGEAEPAGGGDRCGLVVKIPILGDQRSRSRAVEQPRIEMRQPVMGRDAARDAALARGRGAIDGDDHPEHPSPGLLALDQAVRVRPESL